MGYFKKDMKFAILLPILIFIWSCNNNQPTENFDVATKVDTMMESNSIFKDWITDSSAITEEILFYYKYPKTLQKDFIQNGICFGEPSTKDSEFPNDMKLCVWFNDEKLENLDTIINSEGRVYDFKITMFKEKIKVDNNEAHKIKYCDKNGVVVKQVVLLTKKGTLFQIIANNIDTTSFKNFVKDIRITENKNIP